MHIKTFSKVLLLATSVRSNRKIRDKCMKILVMNFWLPYPYWSITKGTWKKNSLHVVILPNCEFLLKAMEN